MKEKQGKISVFPTCLGCVTIGLLSHAMAAQWSRLYYVRSVYEVSTTQSLAVDRMEKTIGLYAVCYNEEYNFVRYSAS